MSADEPPPYPGIEKSGFPPPDLAHPQKMPPGTYPQGPYAQPGTYPQGPYAQPAQYNMQSAQTTVVMGQPAYTVIQHFHEAPVCIKCQYCQADVVTSTYYETGTMTWVACFVIAFFIAGLGCCLIPFCLDSCKDVVHQCPNCHQQVGRFNRM